MSGETFEIPTVLISRPLKVKVTLHMQFWIPFWPLRSNASATVVNIVKGSVRIRGQGRGAYSLFFILNNRWSCGLLFPPLFPEYCGSNASEGAADTRSRCRQRFGTHCFSTLCLTSGDRTPPSSPLRQPPSVRRKKKNTHPPFRA